ncbi:hypothetical protein WICMUC_005149 [Wickerhamomyces mucosus]|uniref:Inheritance of peroxisomes protein 1 n=1 Tax=Wickerhamomyces mucosus TaxID=1378264 RepID=A0A9P8P9Z3_9ASCO|nr:hypothetical protein WICMUC_005149 [Wickerhamomyces mucosus]
MTTSTSRITHTLSSPLGMTIKSTNITPIQSPISIDQPRSQLSSPFQSINFQDEIIDITNSKKLLKPISSKNDINLTPRKRALANKKSNNYLNQRIISDPIQSIPSPPISSKKDSPKEQEQEKEQEQPNKLNDNINEDDPEAKIILFQFPKAEVLAFEELSMEESTSSPGRLIGYGNFEIFQLHQKSVSYLHCGSVVHPILPKLKILKISKNQFILALSNPERYWRIILKTEDLSIIKDLECSFRKICFFRDLHFAIESNNEFQEETQEIVRKNSTISNQSTSFLKNPILKLPKNDSSVSISSINTGVACFSSELELESPTFVDDSKSVHREEGLELQRSNSNVSSLDLALDDFFDNDQEEEGEEESHYYTAYGQILDDDSISGLSSPVIASSSFFNPNEQSNSIIPINKPSLLNLYESESNWMDPTEDLSQTSINTPRTSRYISLNLNPQKRVDRIKDPILKHPIDSQLNRKNYRLSSYEVFNLVRNEDISSINNDDNPDHNDSNVSFSSFLKTMFI